VAIFLGIDGGGSKTTCVVGDETSILASATGAGSSLIRSGEASVRAVLDETIRRACSAAGVTPSAISFTCIGMAGAARPGIAEIAHTMLAEIVSGEIEVVGDMVIALEAGFGAAAGVVVISGTGSIAYGRNSAGETARAGGWGFAVSDEGSGYWIGRSAVAMALRACDEPGREDVPLLAGVMKSWGTATRDQLVLRANASPPPDFAALLPVVLAAADGGDPIARKVLTQAGCELAGLALQVIQRLFSGDEVTQVALSGGVFRNSELVRGEFCESLRRACPRAVVNTNVVDPVLGALERARRNTVR